MGYWRIGEGEGTGRGSGERFKPLLGPPPK